MHRKAETCLKMYRVSRLLIFVSGKSIDVNHNKNIADDDLFLSLVVGILFFFKKENKCQKQNNKIK